MNGSYCVAQYVVRLRGLPWNTTQAEIFTFLQGCKIRQIQFVTNDQGRSTGECFVVLETKEDIELARSYDKKKIGTRYIEVFESSTDAMSDIIKNSIIGKDPSNSKNNLFLNDNWQEPVVRLRGLPYSATKTDIIDFFNGLDIAQNGVHISSSKPAGEAFVAFTNMDNALRALEFNRMNMGHRYIEVFKSTYAEARASILNDTQIRVQQKTNPRNQLEEDFPNDTSNNYYPDMNHYPKISPSPNDRNRQDYPMPDNQSGSLKRSAPQIFNIKLRGVPFEASEKEIYGFFNPVVPIRIEQENTVRGRPPVWYAEFGSREEANEAMTFHKKYMGQRYIELFPMYDDDNRGKMFRS